MSEWIVSAASIAVSPSRSVHARVSFSPAVKNVIRSSVSASRRTTSPSADSPLPRNSAASSRAAPRARPRASGRCPSGAPFTIASSGFVVSGSSSGGSSSVHSAIVLPASRCASSRSSCSTSCLQLRVARLRLLRDALEPPLDVVAVGDEQLELQRLEVVGRHPRAGEAVEHDEQRVDLPQVAEQRRPGAAHVDDADRGRRDLARVDDVGELRRAAGRGSAAMPTLLAVAARLARVSARTASSCPSSAARRFQPRAPRAEASRTTGDLLLERRRARGAGAT